MARRSARLAAALLLLLVLAPLAAGCDTPPQVLEISPDRNAQQVPSNADVTIRFDRAVDRRSVAAHFSLTPAVRGTLDWPQPDRLVFHHDAFRPSTTYRVTLSAGYRDAGGHANTLDHGWSFRTEVAPRLLGTAPAPAEQNVDPAADLVLTFSRPMDLKSLAPALTIAPSVRYRLRTDPGDERRVVVAPATLLDPGTAYSVTVTPDARDVDGNPLAAGIGLDFTTGPLRPLRHWVTFGASEGGSLDGIWVVDERRLPRQVADLGASGFSWSQDGSRLLVQGVTGVWSDVSLEGDVAPLPFRATWAAFLAPGDGYVYLQPDGQLARQTADGRTLAIDRDVSEASVAAGGRRIAYVTHTTGGGWEIRGYAVELRSHYRLQAESLRVDGLAWAPDASRLAYRLATADPAQSAVRVRDLLGGGTVRTVGVGTISTPTWQADSRHVLLSATVVGASGPTSRAFRLSATEAASRPLVFDDAIPSPPEVEVRNPLPSPDGHQLAFLAPSAGGDQIWMMNEDGTGLTQVTRYDAASFPYSCDALTWTRS